MVIQFIEFHSIVNNFWGYVLGQGSGFAFHSRGFDSAYLHQN